MALQPAVQRSSLLPLLWTRLPHLLASLVNCSSRPLNILNLPIVLEAGSTWQDLFARDSHSARIKNTSSEQWAAGRETVHYVANALIVVWLLYF